MISQPSFYSIENLHPEFDITKIVVQFSSEQKRRFTNAFTAKGTWLSTSIAMSMNMSCSSRMLASSLRMSLWRASMSASVCFACCVSVMICTTSNGARLHYSDTNCSCILTPCVKTAALPLSIISSICASSTFLPAADNSPVAALLPSHDDVQISSCR